MKLEGLIDPIPQRWRGDFIRFIETGEATDEFLGFLDTSMAAQAAVEQAFQAQADSFETVARMLKDESGDMEVAGPTPSVRAAAQVDRAMEALPESEQVALLQRTADRLRHRLPKDLHADLRTIVSEVGAVVSAGP